MKPSALKNLLVKLIPLNEPVLIVGSPGVGKTDTWTKACGEVDYDLMVLHPVVDDPTDYKGMPAITSRGSGKAVLPAAEFLPFGNLHRMIEADKPTQVFFDDLGQSVPAVQAAVMQLILAREINGRKISPHVTFGAATNRRQDKAAVTGLITPLLDRFTTVLTMDFDLDDWVEWGIHNNMPAELLAFARFRSDLISKFEANKDMKKSPTPRSVAGVGRLVNAGITDYEVISGAAGEGFATEFVAFYRTWSELPNREEIYLNPDTAPLPVKMDVLYALMGSLAHGATIHNFEQTVRYLNRVKPELSVLCVKDAMTRTPGIKATKAFMRWAVENKAAFGYDP